MTRYITALKEGSVLAGKYVVGKVLGKGGFGVTYLCYDLQRKQKVAIKEYFPESVVSRNTGENAVHIVSDDKRDAFTEGAKKFYEEAQTVSKFNSNPNIIHVYEFFYENNTAYFVMEYLDGIDLKRYTRNNGGKLAPENAVSIISKVVNALTVVHAEGVLHRDISPDNIFVCKNGDVKLIDFGAARFVLSEVSQSLSVILKRGFAPLEQYNKKGNQGPWTDIYALGATFYFLLTGKIVDDVMSRIDDEALDFDGIPRELRYILARMLAVKTQDRYQSTYDLTVDLSKLRFSPVPSVSRDISIGEKPDALTENVHDKTGVISSDKQKKKSRALPIALISAFAVAVISLAVVFLAGKSESDKQTTVNRYENVSSVTLSATRIELLVGKTYNLFATIKPLHLTDKSVVWSSSDYKVVSVDTRGNVTAMSAGSAKITATSDGVSATCVVVVYDPTPAETTPEHVPEVPEDIPDVSDPIPDSYEERVVLPENIKVGNYIKFGKYEQDNDFSNGKEEIEWKVLAIEDGKALLISKYGLDAKPFNDVCSDVKWDTCTLRKWLNAEFINAAFSDSEAEIIPYVTVNDSKNPDYGTYPGGSTTDKVFLLSFTEAKRYFSSDEERKCKPTEYALNQGVWIPGEPDKDPEGCWWWLRSPGDNPRKDDLFLTGTVNRAGWINYYGNGVEKAIVAVRPAIWIDLNY